jgi:antibiotic biosynthesis monooxygenase (ABM) superfamily enzyme
MEANLLRDVRGGGLLSPDVDTSRGSMSNQTPVTVAVIRVVKPGSEEAFERAIHDFVQRSLHLPGQLGVHILRPAPGSGSREYGILRRFASAEARDEFYRLPLFNEWRQEVAGLVEGEPRYEHLSGLETWFTLPGQRAIVPPPRWKMALVTAVGVWPASMLVPWLLTPLIRGLPSALQALLVAVGIVILLTWVIMPALVRILKRWL